MGQDVDTALRGQQLVAELAPACLAMCGICGGWRRKVALGDLGGSFWHRIGLARFEPGELDDLLPEGKKLRLPDDHTFLPPR